MAESRIFLKLSRFDLKDDNKNDLLDDITIKSFNHHAVPQIRRNDIAVFVDNGKSKIIKNKWS